MVLETRNPQRARARSRSNDLGRGLVWVIAVFAALIDAVGVFSIVTGRFFVNALYGDLEAHQSLDALPQILQAELQEGQSGDLTDLSLGVRLLCALPTIIHLATMLTAAWLVTRSLGEIADGRPFSALSVRGWAGASVALIVGGVLQGIADTIAVAVLRSLVFDEYARTGGGEPPLGADYIAIGLTFPDWPWIFLALGVIAGAVAIGFREGRGLQHEVDGVV